MYRPLFCCCVYLLKSYTLTPIPDPKVYITLLPAILPADKLKHEKN
jgi:hypothetical protein